jgi:predicted dehydrogenase
MSRHLRWGVLGAARIAARILPALHSLPRHQVVAVASRDASRADAFAQQWGVPHVVASYEALIDRDDIDVVYVPLPNALHAEWTIRAARAGKHVLCEKPLATSVADVDAIIEAAGRHGVCVSEAFMYRHHPQTARVLDVVARGDLGEVRLVRGTFSFVLTRPGDVRWVPELGGGALWDVGCYPVSFARLVLRREPDHATAAAVWSGSGVDEGVDESLAGAMGFPRGALATFDCSFRGAPRSWMEIVGTDAVMHVPVPFKPGSSERLVLTRGEASVQIDIDGWPLVEGELEDMADQVLEGKPPRIPLEDSRANVAVLAALRRSALEGRTVSVAEACPAPPEGNWS